MSSEPNWFALPAGREGATFRNLMYLLDLPEEGWAPIARRHFNRLIEQAEMFYHQNDEKVFEATFKARSLDRGA